MKPSDWYADEQSRRSIDEVRRLWLRGRRRPALLAASVVILLGYYGYKKSRPPIERHTARAAFIVREFTSKRGTGREDRERPPTTLMMQEHLGKVLFNRTTLLEIMAQTKLYGKLPELAPEKAVARFKTESGFYLKDNGFADESENGPRSAKLWLKFTHGDPVVASVVVEAMATAVHHIETRSRETFYDAATSLARGRLEEEQALLTQLEDDLARMRHSDRSARKVVTNQRDSTVKKVQALLRMMGSNETVTSEQESWSVLDRMRRTNTRGMEELLIRGQEINESVIALRIQIEAAQIRVGEVAKDLQQITLSRAEDRRSGIQFDLVDSSTIALTHRLGPIGLIIRVLLAFMVLVPLCGIVIGAFDSKIYSTDDLGRLGVKILGTIPAFPGDQVASLRDRMKSAAGRHPNPLS